MDEFDSVSVSTYEAASLAAKLSEKSADGWEVVAIVPTGSDITAFVKRAGSRDGAAATERASTETADIAASAAGEPVGTSAVSEPAGWGTAPASSGTDTSSTPTSSTSWGSGASTSDSSSGWGGAATSTAASTPAASTTATQPPTPSVPPGWYHDPAGRYELRYWDGSAWTEHVSRGGQQYTDPPVA